MHENMCSNCLKSLECLNVTGPTCSNAKLSLLRVFLWRLVCRIITIVDAHMLKPYILYGNVWKKQEQISLKIHRSVSEYSNFTL